ncbi:MAG: GNAT family N-acetyltransferase [Xanthomonadales bacterium]|nr:GNAT family N-acetyltransferase [Gammaproteobacteria bacterium]NNJ77789.1 GNAT family N-acetyltransferase [Xanthomonadales bacterium]NNL04672.1 GNAT family N-acetyltransferase [Xanthomonadales bacterium]
MKPSADCLRTDRLRLDRLTASDAPLMLSVWNDPAFMRFVGDRGIRTEQEALDALHTGALKLWTDFGIGPYRVTVKGTGEVIGICGLFKRDNLDTPDIGYGLLPVFCGRGYALEAARAVRDHAQDSMGLRRLVAIVSPNNSRSIRLLEKLGMTLEGPVRMPGEDEDILLYEMTFGERDVQ